MKILQRIEINNGNDSSRSILFGIPDSANEMKEMFRLRYDSYLENGYIESNEAKLDQDKYDNLPDTYYVLAKMEGQAVGTARIIKQHPLPTIRDCFELDEPQVMRETSPTTHGEISRLIARYPYNYKLPPHTILVGLLDALDLLAEIANVDRGYCFVKKTLFQKFNNLNIKVHLIENYKLKYSDSYLHNYFYNSANPVYPIYYTKEEIRNSLKDINQRIKQHGLDLIQYDT